MILKNSKEKALYFYTPIILFIFLPFALITGPFLSDLSISIISIIFLIYCVKKKNFSYFQNKYFYFFLLFWLYLLLNSILININFDSLKISFFYFRFGIFSIAIATILSFDSRYLKYFFYSICICFFCLIIDSFYQYFNGKNLLGFVTPDKMRVSSFFGDEMILGSYVSRLYPLLLGLSLIYSVNNKIKINIIIIIILLLSYVVVFISGDRANFFYINFSLIFIILLFNNFLKLRILFILGIISLTIFVSYLNPIAKQRLIDRSLQQMNLFKTEKSSIIAQDKIIVFTEVHTHFYKSAYSIFLDNKLLGVGVKNYRKICKNQKYYKNTYSCSTHPHNTYLQLLAETGLVGFSFLIILLYFFSKMIIQHLKLKLKKSIFFTNFQICILSGLVIYLWPLVPTSSVFNNWTNIFIYLYFPFLLFSKQLKNDKYI